MQTEIYEIIIIILIAIIIINAIIIFISICTLRHVSSQILASEITIISWLRYVTLLTKYVNLMFFRVSLF